MPYFRIMTPIRLAPILALVFHFSYLLQQPSFAQKRAKPTSGWAVLEKAPDSSPLPGTKKLTRTDDISSAMITGIDKFLLKQIDQAVANQEKFWKRDLSSHEAYNASIAKNRKHLAEIIGLSDEQPPGRLVLLNTTPHAKAVVKDTFIVYDVRWPVLDDLNGAGLLLIPNGKIIGNVIAIPDADQSPEQLASPDKNSPTGAYAQALARSGFRVLIPTLINRTENEYKMSNREWLHRPSFELGYSLAGYELQKILAGVTYLKDVGGDSQLTGVIGWGEGGRLALYAGALDTRIDAVAVCGYFGSRKNLWEEPADRNVFRLLNEFGDAQIAAMIAPRPVIIEHSTYPDYSFRADANRKLEVSDGKNRPTKKGKPGKLIIPTKDEVKSESAEARALVAGIKPKGASLQLIESKDAVSSETLTSLTKHLGASSLKNKTEALTFDTGIKADERHDDQLNEILRHNQRVLQLSYERRLDFMKDLKVDSVENFEKSTVEYRRIFREDIIGEFDLKKLAPNPKTRKYQTGPKTVSYEVVLDVFPDVLAYGILTLPKDLKLDGSDKRPVVVCQHGLEGRPQDVVGKEAYRAYKSFATHLAERGFITFAPQNPYIFMDRFRTLQFKSQSIGKTLFSIAVPQHQQITDWLGALPFTDAKRIGFYGLSYGGKSAMRIPPLVENYALSICSADFGEWVWKNAATDKRSLRYSYANKGEYEIFEWNLGGTFNYAEMAALICPRPFMVERGHFDGVQPDDRVAQEFAKIRIMYQGKLKIGDRTEIEFFDGPHSIHEVGTYKFLHKHLNWPEPKN